VQIGTSDPRGNGMKRSTVGVRRSKVNIIQVTNPFRQDLSRTVQTRHAHITVNARCVTTTPMQTVKGEGQGHISPK